LAKQSLQKGPISAFSKVKEELSVAKGLLLRGNRVVIPSALQPEILDKLHAGHQGLVKCHRRASYSVWWPKLHQQIEETVAKCPVCIQYSFQPAQPLTPSQFPERLWQKVGTDLLEWKIPHTCWLWIGIVILLESFTVRTALRLLGLLVT
jgi:hypothetical protein